MTIYQYAADHNHIHISPQEATDRLSRRSDDRFVLVQRRIQNNRHTGLRMESAHQTVIQNYSIALKPSATSVDVASFDSEAAMRHGIERRIVRCLQR